MAAALPLAADAMKPVTDFAAKQAEKFSDDPATYISSGLMKWGAVLTGAGVLAWVGSKALPRAEQAYLNDIQDRLGLARTNSPTPPQSPPPPPPPPVGQSALTSVATAIASLSTTDPTANFNAIQVAVAAMTTLVNQLKTLNAPAAAQTWATTVQQQLSASAALFLTISQGLSTDWTSATNAISSTPASANTLADQLGLSHPFNIPAGSTPDTGTNALGIPNWAWGAVTSSPIVNNPIVQGVGQAGLTLGSAIGIAAQDVTQFAGDVASGVALIGKAIQNFPVLFFDAIGYGITWGVSTILADLWPYLLGFGVGMLAVGVAIRFVRVNLWPHLKPRIELGTNARMAKFWNLWDRRFHTHGKVLEVWEHKGIEGEMAAANVEPVYVAGTVPLPSPPIDLPGSRPRISKVPTPKPSPPPVIEAAPAAEPKQSEPEGLGGAGSSPGPAVPQGPATEPPKPQGPGLPPLPDPPPIQGPPPAPVAATTAETEADLGDSYTQAKDRMKAALRERDMPKSFDQARVEQAQVEKHNAEDEMRRALATREGAEAEHERLTRQIKEAQAARREAKVALTVHEKARSGGKVHRGAVEGMDREYFAAEIP